MQIFYRKAWHVEAMTSLQCNGGPTGGVTLFRGLFFLSPRKNLAVRIPEAVKKPFFVSVSSFEVYREVVIEKSVMNFWCNLQLLDNDPTWRLLFELCLTGSCTKSSPATYPKPDISWQSWVSEDFWQEAPFQVETRSTDDRSLDLGGQPSLASSTAVKHRRRHCWGGCDHETFGLALLWGRYVRGCDPASWRGWSSENLKNWSYSQKPLLGYIYIYIWYVCFFWKPTYTWTSHSCHWLAILDDAEAWAPGGLCLGVGDGIAQWSKASQKREHESQSWSDFSD